MNHDLTDFEHEEHIKSCGQLMQQAYEAGNKQEAEYWMLVQNQAIAMRSPAQVARMEAERGLTPEPYFLNKAEEDLPAILRRQAA